jgi:hypothetical protein
MIARYLHSLESENSTAHRRPKGINFDHEEKFIQLCFARQSEKNSVTVQDPTDFMHDNQVQVNGFWVGDSPNAAARH